jgi:hypothetical protein
MRKNLCTLVIGLAWLGACALDAAAQTVTSAEDMSGVVARVDDRHKVVVFEDGRMVRATPATIIMVGGRSVAVGDLKPGAMVVVRSGEAVMVNGGQYVTVGDPSAAVGVPPPGAVRTRVYGRVKDIDRNGEVKIQTQSGSFHVRISPDAARTLKNGDTVTVDVVITPPAPTVR